MRIASHRIGLGWVRSVASAFVAVLAAWVGFAPSSESRLPALGRDATECNNSTEVNSSGGMLCNGQVDCTTGHCEERTYEDPEGYGTYTWCACEDPDGPPFFHDSCHAYVYTWIFVQRRCTIGNCASPEHCEVELGSEQYKACECR